jgi:hypothetical protein
MKLSIAEVARELLWGEEVDGLIDIPVREILDRLKHEFPRHEENSGLLLGHGATGSFEATWTWQFVKIECRELALSEREKLSDAIESFGCVTFDPQLDGGRGASAP